MIDQTSLPDVLLITPPRFGDHRGFFSESWNKKKLEAEGVHLGKVG
ncbi:dTDP-4-dehydrorhamnose 3,5-epimerase family protein (plasmid) [Thioclava sp. 'Guangxiensis']